MILPDDDSIVIPDSDDGEIVVDETNPPAPSLADTQALLPGWARKAPSALRGAWLAAWGKVANTVWARTSFALEAQQSPRFAEGTGLDWHGQRRAMPRVAGESDADYRARLLSFNDVVSPNAVHAAVDPLVAKSSTVSAVHLEPAVDAMFLSTTSSPWQAFIQSSTRRLWANYPDRPSGWVGGAYIAEAVGGQGGTTKTPGIARFWIVLPFDSGDDTTAPHAMPSTTGTFDYLMAASGGIFQSTIFLSKAPPSLIESVAQSVEAVRGGGVQFGVVVDPLLLSAI